MIKVKEKKGAVILLMMFFILCFAGVALAGDTTVTATPTSGDINNLGKPVAMFTNFLKYIGSTVLIGFGYWHAFGLGAAAKNANKRAAAIEALGWTAVAAILFFGAPLLLGVFSGIGSSVN